MNFDPNKSFAAKATPVQLLTGEDRNLLCSLSATLIDAGNINAGMKVAAFLREQWPHDEQVLFVNAHAYFAQREYATVVALLAPGLMTGKFRKPQLFLMFAVASLKTMQHAKAFDAARRYLKVWR